MGMAVRLVSDQMLEGAIFDNEVTVVTFMSVVSEACARFSDELEAVALVLGDKAPFFRIDVMENPTAAKQFKINEIPTTVVFREGKEVLRVTGPHARKELHERLLPSVKKSV